MDETKISKHQLYFDTALYKRIKKVDLAEDVYRGEFVGFNPTQKYRTTFTIQKSPLAYRGQAGTLYGHDIVAERSREKFWDDSLSGMFCVVLTCKQAQDKILIFFEEEKDYITKVGQTPSLADIRFAEVANKYEKQLSESDLKNYKMAIFGHAHGVGVGSFVYLRRIFENLIDETFKLHGGDLGLKEKVFEKLRMEDKVDALKSVLPSQLVEMKVTYGILSKGLHELTEEDCLKYFLPIRLSIELILEQKIEEEQKADRDKAVKAALSQVTQEVSKKEV